MAKEACDTILLPEEQRLTGFMGAEVADGPQGLHRLAHNHLLPVIESNADLDVAEKRSLFFFFRCTAEWLGTYRTQEVVPPVSPAPT